MPMNPIRIITSLDSNPNIKTTVNTRENLGVVSIGAEREVRVRQIGIGGQKGDTGDTGAKGDTGDTGATGEVGITWKGVYDENAIYKKNDVIKYFGTTYIYVAESSTQGSTPSTSANWEIFSEAGAAGDLNDLYIQTTSSNLWVVNHGLNKYPVVTSLDSSGNIIEGDVRYIDAVTVILTFSIALTGQVFLN